MTLPEDAAERLQFERADLIYHQARVLLVIDAICRAPGTTKKLDGLTKLAKLDFLVRYPALALRVLPESASDVRLLPSEDEQLQVEAPMIRYRYGPWDDKYYPVIGALVGRGLVAYAKGRRGSVALRTTPAGRKLVAELVESAAWANVASRCEAIAEKVGSWNGNQLKEAVYAGLPEVVELGQREVIR